MNYQKKLLTVEYHDPEYNVGSNTVSLMYNKNSIRYTKQCNAMIVAIQFLQYGYELKLMKLSTMSYRSTKTSTEA